MVENALRRGGYTVLAAADAGQAVAVARSHPGDIALLITDVVMPGMPGGAIADAIRQLRPGTRVLFMSGYSGGALDGLAPRAALLEKPFGPEELLAAVRSVFDGGG